MRSIWERLFGAQTPPARRTPANDEGLAAALADMRERVRIDVASGFHGWEALVDNAVAYVEADAPGTELRPYAERMVAEALAEHRAAEKSWPAVTDFDRLDSAFAALEAGGIVMRHNFTCCGTCGSAEIWDEMDAFERSGGGTAYGYGFYHMQDTERAVDGGGLYLNYGARDEGEEPAVATGRAIVAELERQGLSTDWDGSWEKRIAVAIDWRRREGA